jgi:DDE superfamily endonuclease
MTVDGTDFRIAEHGKPFYSFKFRKSALRYEVALCILTGDIVWINGPYEAGRWNDISIFRNSLMSHLAPNERVEADDGYVGEHPQHVKCPKGFANIPETEYMQQRARNQQETVNKRFKNWGCMKQVWRHDIALHGEAFRATAVVTQISINNGEKLFEVGYRDPPWERANEESADDDKISM